MSDFRILITGSRDWTDRRVITDALDRAFDDAERIDDQDPQFDRMVVVHGGAPGADTIAGEIAKGWGFPVEVHRAQWQDGPSAGPRRNRHMVALGADVCLAFPIGASPGTRGCMALAEAAGIPVVVTEGAVA